MTVETTPNNPVFQDLADYPRDFGVRDRVAVITGAGQGIGREYARQFAAADAVAVVAELDEAKGRAVVSEIEAAGGRAMFVRTDIGDVASVDAMAAAVTEKYGRIDILLNNASLFATLQKRPFDEVPLDEWDRVIKVNITGSFLCARAVVGAMRRQNWGRIINISSDSVPMGVANYLHYVTSKSAIIGMTSSLARELGPNGITVNAIRPGGTATEVDRAVPLTAERQQRLMTMQCIPKVQMPSDLVGLVLFLSSAAGGFITGQTIACDGGLTH